MGVMAVINAAQASMLAELCAVDGRLADAGIIRHSLNPTRDRATSLEQLGRRLCSDAHQPTDGVALALAKGLIDVVHAIQHNFPDNLFWDLDHLWGAICTQAASPDVDGEAHARKMWRKVVALQRLYGRHTRVRFRYAHDFLYGYDWAKWVRKDVARRADIRPFDEAFLDVLQTRGEELIHLIDRNDATYPELPEGRARNPFGFTREPIPERTLHRDLAKRALVPVQAWMASGRETWRNDYSAVRAERAVELGFGL